MAPQSRCHGLKACDTKLLRTSGSGSAHHASGEARVLIFDHGAYVDVCLLPDASPACGFARFDVHGKVACAGKVKPNQKNAGM
eukprot:979752-Lingulodinium_polyedra.AAC.1